MNIDYVVTTLDRHGRKELEEKLFEFKLSSQKEFVIYSHYGLWAILRDITYKINLKVDLNIEQQYEHHLFEKDKFKYIIKKI